MSQSPETARATPDAVRHYEDSWEAIYNLIDEGASWSGHEKNCVFLNTHALRFANASAATGLDFPDDSRALAWVDWDFDGQLDVWMTNRTAPRVRFLRNASAPAHHWIQFRLHGTKANRDAIGARVELVGDDGSRQIRTVRAGDGYLSQSSKWVHFGLGRDERIRTVRVRWPGGGSEEFSGLAADERWDVVEGRGRAERWQPPRPAVALSPGALPVPDPPTTARTWVSGRVPLPVESTLDWDGAARPLKDLAGHPVLLTLWSRTCGPCLAELEDFHSRREELAAAGITVVPLCVDDDAVDREAAAALARKFGFPGGRTSPELITAFETTSRALLESRRPLPVPCSLLLDRRGLVSALYKGRIDVATLLADVALLDGTPEAQRAASLPFAGRWRSPPPSPNPRQVIGTLMKGGQTEAARTYTRRLLDPASPLTLPVTTRASLTLFLGDLDLDAGRLDEATALYAQLFELAPDDAAIHREAAIRLVTKQRTPAALRHLEKAVALAPTHADSRLNLATLLQREGRIDEAIGHFDELARQHPDSAPVHFYLANSLQQRRRTREAIDHYRAASRLAPDSAATNNLAWILATHPDPSLRNGTEAVRLAEQACSGAGSKDPVRLGTLAAAYAEAGRFDQAVATAESALNLATAADPPDAVARLRSALASFKAGRPLRE